MLGHHKGWYVLNPSSQQGVSLIELVVGITIVAGLMAVGLPSYATWIQNSKIRTATESVLNGMQLARAEAVRRNANVQLLFGAGSSWTISVPSTAEQIQARSAAEGSSNVTVTMTPATARTLTFNSLGRVAPNADASAPITRADLSVPTSVLAASAARELRIVVGAGGNVRMCDPDAGVSASDSRKCP